MPAEPIRATNTAAPDQGPTGPLRCVLVFGGGAAASLLECVVPHYPTTQGVLHPPLPAALAVAPRRRDQQRWDGINSETERLVSTKMRAGEAPASSRLISLLLLPRVV